VFDKYYRAVCYFSFQLLKDRAEAEDVAMETFLRYINHQNEFLSDAAVKAFLFKVARNKCVDYLRKQSSSHNYQQHITQTNYPSENTVNNEQIIAGLLQLVYEEIEKLPQQRKQIFKAVFIEGKDTSTIAGEMNLSPQTVLNQKTKALQMLKQTLQKLRFSNLYSLLPMAILLFFKKI
ncbi:MAG TPA: sigma-70 family RNA polymerase sigma factor, partial [Chitinophagaceae bacterium]|nr:sigma-70 family RNA polymerase sigma factor [Chitinophagaceae bacterium]